ncbi:uncharacterized protein LOC135084809 [Ostrinia nubilalis]|uniref:uncharacterized protein LOC135084809 n=1 Tax=Ostrinia nubilalis TaxID=29057 RepID=UPI00308239AF
MAACAASPTCPACRPAPGCYTRRWRSLHYYGVVWCVTDLSRVPPGAWLLHPQTGRPLSNPDGSVYRYDPNNPPVLDETYHLEDDQINQNDKKRGKLEKQDSFIDHGECDCPPPEETRNKCCCECRQHDACQRDADKHTSDEKQEPLSPCKNNYESNNQDSEKDIQKSAENNFECDTQYSPQLAYESYESYEQPETVADQGAQYDTLADQNQAYEAVANQSGQQFNSASPRTQQFDPNNQKTQQFDANSQRTQQFDTNNQKTKHFDTTSQRTQQFDSINQIAHQYDPTNQKVHQFDPNNQAAQQFDPATQRTHQFDQNNQRTQQFDPNNQISQQFDTNLKRTQPYELTSQRTPQFESTNQRTPQFEPASQRTPQFEPANQLAQSVEAKANEDSHEIQYNQYAVRTDEVTSPPESQQCQPTELALQSMAQAKATPVPIPDPYLRPMSINNVVYPTMHQGYPYINQCRIEPTMPVYQQVLGPPEDAKQMTSPPHQEPTFRIDPSYPYAAVDYAAQCGACVDPNAMRSYNLPYGQMEIPQAVLPPAYPVGNVIIPQPHIQYPVSCGKVQDVLVPQALLPPAYPVGNVIIPQPHIQYPVSCIVDLEARWLGGKVQDVLVPQALLPPAYPVGNVIIPQPHIQYPVSCIVDLEARWLGGKVQDVLVPQALLPPAYPVGNVIIPQPHIQYPVSCIVDLEARWLGDKVQDVVIPQAVLPPAYPVGNVIIPQPHIQYPYQEAAQWAGGPLVPLGGKLILPEPYPALYHQLYQCGLVYPPVMPAPSPVWAPEPRPAPPPRPHCSRASPARRDSDEIAVKIQQIKEQMAELNTREKERGTYNKVESTYKGPPREEWRKRNNGSGILGNYPHGFQGRTRFEG